jgi:fumarate hydratase, class II
MFRPRNCGALRHSAPWSISIIGKDLIPREMIAAYATLKKAAANANHSGRRLDDDRHRLIVQTCDEILAGRHEDMFPLQSG